MTFDIYDIIASRNVYLEWWKCHETNLNKFHCSWGDGNTKR